ncbi:ribonuclease H, partial [Trifolium pratense]
PDKAPGPDGFNPAFYQHFWDLCGNDVFEAAQEWLERGFFPSSLNETNICLIPKCENPTTMKDLRPISLCNVLYKMISKLLANRLKSCLDKCVSEEQSAFIEGRSILDNALIAIEVIHALKRRTRGLKGELALKIDISKAYDKVDWGFMRGMLERLGFSNTWIHWMMLCVSSVNYSVLVNFEKVGPIVPGRGLRQGDPLSPYLFLLVTEGLTKLIHKSLASGELHGVKICRGAPSVSHLLFADDCFLFCRATVAETELLMKILKTYEEASGQEINLAKSEVFFSRNLSAADQEDLSKIMGVRHVLGTGNYLGLPSMVGRKKKHIFAFLKDRIWKRINAWRGRSLSRAGKEVMIKSVLQAIPSYVMSVYLLPDGVIKDIERMMNSFWWGGGANNKGIRWLAWDRMTIPKDQGGMGFRDLHSFNLAMIAKQGWNIMTKPHTILAKLYKARYFPNSSLFESKLGHNPSYAWRGIWKARQILMNGCRWRVGNGKNIKVMSEPWLRGENGAWLPSPQDQGVHNYNVNDLMMSNVTMWDKDKIESLFSIHIANRILGIPLFDMVEEDKLLWIDSTNGNYNVKSGYKLMMKIAGKVHDAPQQAAWRDLWSIQAPPKAKHLLWRVSKGCLPTRLRLQERQVSCPLLCPVCNQENEDDWHVFFGCEISKQAWQAAGILQNLEARLQHNNNANQLIHTICSTEDKETAGMFAMLAWVLWNNRNNMVWNDTNEPGRSLGIKARVLWEEWNSVQQVQQGHSRHEQQQHTTRWQTPDPGWYKCNVDAGFHQAINKTSTGWVLRDDRGRFVMAETTWMEGNCSIMEGESIALIKALETLSQRGISKVIFETDSKSVVDAVHRLHSGSSEFSLLISHINKIMLCNPNFKVKFIKRQANMVAHTLARAAISWPRRCYFETLPICIASFLNNEMI